MELVLHHCHDARSMRSLWLLHELGLDFDLVVHEFGPDLHAPGYARLSPAGRVPALVIDGEPMTESGAITEVLCETHPGPLFRPPGHPQRRNWLEWLHFSETMGAHLATLTQSHIMVQPAEARPVVTMKIETARLRRTLGVVDAALDGKAHLLGAFTAADIHVGYSVWVAQRYVRLETFDRLPRYLEKLTARPAFAKSLKPEGAQGIYERDFYAIPEA